MNIAPELELVKELPRQVIKKLHFNLYTDFLALV
jgi:hypothetical protein